MAEISLFEYLEKVNQLLDEEQYELAARHCLHILQQFPRHVDTYQALAKAQIGRHKTSDAIELFQRVLSADPNNLIAHIGLSDLYQADMKADLSHWHLQRALDIEPYNAAIQDEYRKLTEQDEEDAFESARLPLTPAAVANVYLRSELYQQATAVLRQALAQSPDRIDLELLLAESLWRDGHHVDASDICRAVINRLPHSVTANAIIADIWMHANRIADAAPFLTRVQSLQPMDETNVNLDSAVGHAFTAPGAPPLPERLLVNMLDETAVAPIVDEPTAEWVSEISFDRSEELQEAEATFPLDNEPEDSYDWLKGVTAELRSEAAAESPAHDEPAQLASAETDWFVDQTTAPGAAADEDSATDWLGSDWHDVAQDEKMVSQPDYDLFAEAEPSDHSEASADASEQDSDAFAAPVPDWLSDEADDSAESEFTVATDARGDMPDWLTESAESDFDAVQLDADSVSDWLQDMGDFDDSEAETGAETAVSEKTDSATDWLAELSDKEQAAGEEDWLAEIAVSDDDFTEVDDDWLAALSAAADETIADTGDLAEEASSDDWLTVESEGDAETISDDWLASLAGDTQEGVSGETIGDTTDLDELSDDWLAALAGDDVEPVPDEPEQALPDDEMNLESGDDWLTNLESPTDFLNELDGLEAAEMSSQDDDKEREQKDLPKPEPEPSTKELMDWLDELDATADEPAAAPVEQPQTTTEEALKPDTAELPDWLADTAEAVEEETAVSHPADLPDWLQESEDLLEEQALSEFDVTSTFEDEQEKEIPGPPTALLDELQANFAQDDQVAAASDDVSWLSELPDTDALGDTSTFDWLDAAEETESVLDWMDDLDADFGDAADILEDELEATELDEPEPPELLEEPVADIPSDLDDAMSWLEDLAAEESAPVEPLPTVAEVLDEGLSPDEFDSDADLDFLESIPAEPDETEVEDASSISEPDQEDALDFLSDVLPAESAEDLDEALPEEMDALGFLESALLEPADEPEEQDEDAAEADALSDLDDAMAWLDEMADSPDMLAEADNLWDEQTEVTEESDTLMDVLAEAGLPTDEGAESTMDEAVAEVPEDLDDAMAWLETLAAKQGAPVEELPSLQIEEQETAPSPDDLVESQIESDAAFVEPVTEPAFDLEAETVGDDMLESIADVPEDLDDAMAWLEELAAKQGAPIEELPTLRTSEPEPTFLESEDDDRVIDVEGAAASAGEPFADEMPVSEPTITLDPELASALDWLEESVADGAGEEVETAVIPQTSDDELAEALDWLEQIALEKPAPAAEPSTDVAEPVDEADAAVDEDAFSADLFDMPEDPDAALAWLEEMSDEQPSVSDTAPVTEVVAPETAVTDPPVVAAEEQPVETIEETSDGLEDLFDGDLFDFPEDPDAALAWLEEVSADDDLPTPTEAPITELIEEPETAVPPETTEDELPSVPEADLEADLLSSVPEDPDEAMAWLEQLAARQGASLDELPSVTEQPKDEVATPDWITEAAAQAEPAAAEAEAAAASSEPVTEEQPDVFFDEDDLLADLDISDIEAAAAESVDDVLDEDVTDDMPSWWGGDKLEDDDEAMTDQAAWLRELPDSDITDWLEAEAAASSASTREDAASPLPETGPIFESASMEPVSAEPALPVEEEMPLLSETDELASSAFHIDEEQLESARSSLTAGELVEALSIYQELVSRGDGLMMLINELETAVSDHPQQLEIHRLLGDAYMRNGQLQKALATYRRALDRL